MAKALSILMRGAVTKRLKALPGLLQAARVRAMDVAVKLVEADLKENSFTGAKGNDAFWGVTGASGDALGARSGHTRRTIKSQTFRAPNVVVGIVGSPLPQMKTHEEGGWITGKPWLRIPTRVMQTATGQDRLAGRSARTLPNTRVIRSRAGNPWIVEVGTPRSKLAQDIQGFPLMLYMLKTRVHMRARHMFKKSHQRTQVAVRALFNRSMLFVVRST